MKINKIKRENNGQYTLLFEDGTKVKTYDDVILKHKLIYDTNLDDKGLEVINDETRYYDEYSKIVKMIMKKLRSEYEIKVYMNKEDIPLPDRLSILERLKDNDLINDLNYAKAYANDKFYLSNYGPLKIKKDLDAYCINPEYIRFALETIDSNDVKSHIHKFIDKKIKANKKDSIYVLKNKIINNLINDGYSKEDIIKELNTFTFESDDAIEKEYKRIKTKLSKHYEGDGLEKEVISKLYQRGFSHDEINSYLEKVNE